RDPSAELPVNAENRPFAQVAAAVLRHLGQRYAPAAQKLERREIEVVDARRQVRLYIRSAEADRRIHVNLERRVRDRAADLGPIEIVADDRSADIFLILVSAD